MQRIFYVALISLAITSAYASSGDRAQIFQDCVSSCHAHSCAGDAILPLALRLTRWTCTDDCKYQCMHLITDAAEGSGGRIHQYHGKWPFWRLAGMQEPASVAFSLLNMLVHIRGARQVQKRLPSGHPMKWYYLAFAAVSVNAWVWSSVFHTRGSLSPYICSVVGLSSASRSTIYGEAGLFLGRIGHSVRLVLHRCPTIPPVPPASSLPHRVTFPKSHSRRMGNSLHCGVHLSCFLPHVAASI